MPNNKIVVTKEQIQKAMACETAEELMALAKAEGIELTKEEAESYLAELEDLELDGDMLKRVAGGRGYADQCWSNNKPLFEWMQFENEPQQRPLVRNSYLKIFQRVDGGQT